MGEAILVNCAIGFNAPILNDVAVIDAILDGGTGQLSVGTFRCC
jgi:hypothetical protein|tara:strand:+ start:224 stop:355 length:132 start_codon:yes stop_codon:yes gene_type:complete